MIASEPPPSGDPGDTPFDHPSSGKRAKTGGTKLICLHRDGVGVDLLPLGSDWTPNNLDGPAQMDQKPEDQIAAIMAISPHHLDAGKQLLDWLQQAFGPTRIGVLGTSHFDGEQMALGINEQVSFPSPDFFSPHRSLFRGHERHSF